jgi:hypothetical protein
MTGKASNSMSGNQGEGNRDAANAYNEATEKFVKSGKVQEKARDAAEALDSKEMAELQRAEAEGKSHSHGEDPAVER